jgi:hypothetical protein
MASNKKEAKTVLELDLIKYEANGSITIKTIPDGYPQFEGVIPAPDVNTKSEKDRLEQFRK